jgi:hypothetical protein
MSSVIQYMSDSFNNQYEIVLLKLLHICGNSKDFLTKEYNNFTEIQKYN